MAHPAWRQVARHAALALAAAACAPSSRWGKLDLSGSTAAVLPANVVAGPEGVAAVRVVLRRGDGTPVAWPGLAVEISAAGCAVGAPVAVDGEGQAQIDVGPCAAGSHVVRVTARDGALVAVVPAVASVNAFAPASANAQAVTGGARLDLVVLAGYRYVGTVQFVSSDPLAELPAPITLTAADHGVLQLPQQARLRTPGRQTLIALDTATGRVLGEEVLAVAARSATGPDAPAQAVALALAAPARVVAGVPFTVAAVAVDASGQPVDAPVGAIRLASTDPQATLPAAATPAGLGATVVFGEVVLRTAGAATVQAQAASGEGGRALIAVTPGPVASLVLRSAAGSGVGPWLAGAGPTLELGARDAFGNAAPDFAGPASLSSSDLAAVLPSSLAPAPGGTGPRRFAVRFTTVGRQTVVARSAGGLQAELVTQVVAAGPLARLVLTVPQAVVDEPVAGVRVATADAYGNRVAGVAAQVSLSCDDPAAASLPTPVQLTVAGDGSASFAGTATFTRPGLVTVRATAWVPAGAGPPPAAAVVQVPVAGAPADAGHVTLTVTGGPAVADGVATVPLRLTGADAQGRPAAWQAVVLRGSAGVSVAVAGGGPSALDANGALGLVARSAVAGAGSVTASLGSVTQQAGVTFVPGPVDAVRATLTAMPDGARADGATPVALTLVARDAQGNAVPGVAVALRSNHGTDVLVPAAAVTDGAGTAQVTLTATAAGTRTVTARAGGIAIAQAVTFVAGVPAAAGSLFTVTPRALAADGQQAATVALLLGDAYGNPLAGRPVTFSATGRGNAFGTATAVTDAQGLATTTLRSTVTEQKTVRALTPGMTFTAPATFTAGPASTAQSSVTVIPAVVVADGASTATLTLHAADAAGRPATGQTVAFTPDDPAVALSSTAGVTDAVGRLQISARSTHAAATVVRVAVGEAQLDAPVTFTAGVASPARSELTLTPAQVAADGAQALAIAVRLADVFGNPVPGTMVQLMSSGSSNVLTPAAGVTDADGRLHARMTSTQAEAKVVGASALGVALTGSASFTTGSGLAATATLTATPGSAPADGSTPVALRFVALDGQGQPVAGAAVALSVTGGAGLLAPAAGVTAADGSFAASLTATSVGTRTVTATTPGASATAAVSFTAPGTGVASSATSSLTLAPASAAVPADDSSGLMVALHLADGSGNPIAGTPVSLSSTGTGNALVFLYPVDGRTDPAGNLQARLTSHVAEAKTITANASGLTLTATAQFAAGPAVALASELQVSPVATVADGTAAATVTVTVRDRQNNAVAGQPVSFTATGSANALGAASTTTGSDGTATVTLRSTRAEAKSVTASFAGTSVSGTASFIAGPAAVAQSGLTLSPASVPADGQAAATLAVHVADAQGNPLAGQAVALGSSGSGNTLSPSSGMTDAAGTFSAGLRATVAEAKTVTAQVAGLTLTAAATFVPGGASTLASTFVAAPTAIVADGSTAAALTLTARDAGGNPVPGLGVTLSAGGAGAAVTPLNGTTAAGGTVAATLVGTLAGVRQVTASFGGTSMAVPVSLVPGAVDPVHTSLQVAPASAVADGAQPLTLTVTLRDAQGNAVSGVPVGLALTGSNGALAPAGGTAAADGTLSATLTSTRAEIKTVTASFPGGSVSNTATFSPGAASSATSTLSAAPSTLAADGTAVATLTAVLRDAQGNPVPGVTVAFTVDGSQNVLTPGAGTTGADGSAAATLTSTLPETKTVTVTFAGTSITGQVGFVAAAPSATGSTVAASPATVVANGSNATTLTATVKDAQSNPVAGVSVSFACSGSGNALSASTATTAADGTASVTLTSSRAEAKTVTASTAGGSFSTGVTFLPGPPSSSGSTLTASPTSLAANGVAVTTLTLVVRDAQANEIGGLGASFSVSGTGNALSGASGTTDATGRLVAGLSSTVAESKVVTATAGGATVTRAVTFTAGAANNATSTLTLSPGGVVADGTHTVAVALVVRDAAGNALPGVPVTLGATGSGNVLTPTSATTSATGKVAATLATTVAEMKSVLASFGSTSLSATTTFVSGTPVAAASALAVTPATVAADGTAIATLTATLRDANGNGVAGTPVIFASTGTGNVVGGGTGTTDAAGRAVATLASTRAEAKAVTATFAGQQLGGTVTFAPTAVAGGSSTFVAAPASAPADGATPLTLTVRALDAQGNGVPGQAVTLAGTAAGDVLTPAGGTTDATGAFSSTLTGTLAGARALTASVAGATLHAAATLTAGPPATARSTITATPASLAADGLTPVALAVRVADAYDNPVPGVAVSLARSGTQAVLTPSSGTTSAAGTVSATVTATAAEAVTLTASFAGTSVTTTATFTSGAAASGPSQVVASPATLVADGVAQSSLTATVRDGQGNPVAGQPVTFSASGTGNVVTPASATTGAAGTATVQFATARAEAKTVTASFAGTSVTTGLTAVAGPVAASTSTLGAAPISALADGTAAIALTAHLTDAQGNAVAGQSVAWAAGGSGNALGAASGTTDAAGNVTTSLRSTVAEAKAVTATAGGVSVGRTVTFLAGAPVPAQSSVAASPASVTANGSDRATVTVRLADAQGNPVAGQAVTLASSGSGNALSAASGTTGAAGTFVATLASTVAQAKTLTAGFSGGPVTCGVTFVAGAPVAPTSQVVAAPAGVLADGSTAMALTATVRDAQGNPVAGVPVTFAASGTGNVLGTTPVATNASGVAATTLASTRAEAKSITASFGGTSVATTASFVAGVPAAATSTVAVSPASVVADGTATATVTVVARDASGNAVAGQSVALSSSGTGHAFAAATGSTDLAGTFVTTLTSTVAQAKTVTATLGGVTATGPVTFVAGPAVSATSSVAMAPATVPADGSSTAAITVRLRDAQGNAAGGVAVTLAATGSGNALSPASGTTAADGTLAVTLASTVAESKTVIASFAGTSSSGQVSFVAAAAVAGQSAVVANPTAQVADGASAVTLTATLRDAQGNAVPGQTVTFAVDGSGNALSATSAFTSASGNAAVTVRSTKAEAKTATASFAGGAVTATVTFAPGAVAQATSTLAASPTTLVADGTATATVTAVARDAQGNAVPGQAVAFASSGTGHTLGSASGTTDAAGTAATTLRGTVAQAKTLTATVAAATLTAGVTLVPAGPVAGTSSVVASPASATADGTATVALTVQLADPSGNPAPGIPVTLSASGSNNVLIPASGTTDASGRLVATLSTTTAEAKSLTAAFAGTQVTGVATFVAAAPTSSTSQLVATPTSLAADGTATATLTATVRDAQGNPVPAQTVSFAASGTGNTLSATTATTSAGGVAAVTLRATRAEAKSVTASFASTSVGATVTFVPGAAAAGTSALTASPASVVADGSATSSLAVHLADANNNPLAGQAVTLASTGSGHTISPASGSTDATGTFAATVRSTVAEAKTLTATVAGLSLPAGVTFVPGAAQSSTSTLTATPGSAAADGVSAVAFALTVRDAQGNAVPGQAVTLAATGTGNTLSPTSGTTAADGTLGATLTSTVPATKTVTASFAGTSVSAAATFVAGSQSTTASQVVASPSSVVADGTHTTTVVATIRDAGGNPLSGQTVTFACSGTGNAFSAPSAVTGPAGTAQVTLTATVAEAKTLTATASGGSVTTGVTFTPGPVAQATSQVSASPASVTADGVATTTVTVLARDAAGNAVPGQAVTLAAGGTGNTLSAASGTTAADGTFSATLKSTVAAAKSLSATVGGVALSGSVTFVPGAAAQGTSAVSASPTTTTADGATTTTVIATLRDASGNPVPGVTVGLTASGSGNTLTPASGTTSATGTVTATLASTVAEAKTLTASFASTSVTGTTTFVAGAAVSTTSTVVAAPGALAADGSATATLTATVRDAQGNPVAGQAVTFAVSGAGNALSGTSGTTSAAGVATVTLSATQAGTKTVTATFNGTSVTSTVTFTPGAVVAANSTLTASPASLTADGTAASALTLLARDAQLNPVPAQAVTLTAGGTGNTLSPSSGSTAAGGTFAASLKSTVAQVKALTATVGGATVNGSVTFAPGSPIAGTSTLTASPAAVLASGSATAALTVTVADAQGNPVPGVAVTLSSSGSNNTLSPASGTTNAAGQVAATLASTTAEAKVVTASFAGTSVGVTVTFTAGAAVQATSQLVASPGSLTADGTTATTLTASIRDAQNNPVAGQTVAFSATGTANTFSAPTATTDASGTARVTLSATKAEAKTVTASFNSTSVIAAVTFVPGAVSAATSSVSASPTGLTADGTATTTVTALLRDAQSNPVPGVSVSLSAGGTGNTLSLASGTTNASGVMTATLRSTVAQAKSLTAVAAGVSLAGSVTFVPGAPTQANSSVLASPASLTADGSSRATLTVRLRDAQGNPVPGVAVTLGSSGTGNTLSPPSGTTDAAGNLAATFSATVAEAKTLTASFASTSVSTTVTFVPGGPVSATSAFTASPASVTANGSSTTTLAATVRDAQGNPVPGQTVTFASTGSNNTFGSTTATTSAGGVASVTLASTKAEAKSLTATVAGATLSATATFVPGAVVAGTSTLTASPPSLIANNQATTTLTLQLADAQGNPVPAAALTLACSGTGNTLSATSGSTDATGSFVSTLRSSVAQAKTVTATATASGAVVTVPVTFVAGPAASATSTLAPSPASATADGTATVTLTLTVTDAQGNPVGGQAATFAATGSGNTLSTTSGTTTAGGTVAFTLRSTVAEAKTVTASFAGTSVAVSVPFVAGAPVAGTSSIVGSPTTLTANGSSQTTLTATLRDAQSNLVSGQSVAFSSSGSGNTLGVTPVTTSAGGIAATTLASTKAEAKTVTATFGGSSVTGTVTFLAGAPAAGTSSLTASPASLTANGSSATTLTALINDAQGNPVAGQPVTLTATGSANTFGAVSGTTSGAGTFVTTLASTKAEAKTLTATFAGLSVNTTATFAPGPMSTSTSTLTAAPALLTADGASTTTLTLTALDAQGNPLAGQTATFSASGSSNTLSSTTATVSGAGLASVTLKSTQAEAKTITATVGAVSKTVAVTFGRASSATSTLVASPTTLAADGTTTTTLTATIRDASSGRLSGIPVTMTATGTQNVFTPSTGVTNASGAFTVTLKSTYAGARTVTATASSAAPTAAVTFTVPVCAATLMLGGPPVLNSTYATGVAIGDLNNDGKSDLCVARYDAALVDVYLGHGNGAFSAVQTVNPSVNPMSCLMVDMNRDGYLDLVLIGGGIAVLMNNGAGTGWSSATYATVIGFNHAVADLNGDGYPDLGTSSVTGGHGVYVSLGTAAGGFGSATQVAVTASDTIADLRFGDFNGDGKQDMVVSDGNSAKVFYLQGAGNGTFGAPTGYSVGGGTGNDVYLFPLTTGDFNGDGKLDVAAVTRSSFAGVLLGNGNGTFQPFIGANTGDVSNALVAADITGDGILDLVSGTWDTDPLTFAGTGTGALTSVDKTYTTQTGNIGGLGRTIAAGDINNDGRVDLAVATRSNYVALLPGGDYVWGGAKRYRPPVGASATTYTLALRDFDGDGVLDIVTTGANTAQAFYRGDGAGAFSAPQALAGTYAAWGVFAADLNADGKLDLVSSSPPAGNYVQTGLGNGDGTFQSPVNINAAGPILWPIAADLNADGVLDLIAPLWQSGGGLSIYFGVGNGTFGAATTYPTDPWPNGVAVADLNGDGKPDLAVACDDNSAGYLDILLNAGAGTFGAKSALSVGTSPYDVRAADFNGDGNMDLVVSAYISNRVSYLAGNGNGTFAAASVIDSACPGATRLGVADMNGDGKLDVMVVCYGNDQTLRLVPGNGNGTFAAPVAYLTYGNYPNDLRIGDLDGDGRPDAVVASGGAPGGFSVLRSGGCLP